MSSSIYRGDEVIEGINRQKMTDLVVINAFGESLMLLTCARSTLVKREPTANPYWFGEISRN